MSGKVDGVIEAVHYKNGQVAMVRAYERRGSTFSDCVLIERKDLLERLKNGARFVVGQRQDLLASTFQLGRQVLLANQDGHEFIATRPDATRDELEGSPVF